MAGNEEVVSITIDTTELDKKTAQLKNITQKANKDNIKSIVTPLNNIDKNLSKKLSELKQAIDRQGNLTKTLSSNIRTLTNTTQKMTNAINSLTKRVATNNALGIIFKSQARQQSTQQQVNAIKAQQSTQQPEPSNVSYETIKPKNDSNVSYETIKPKNDSNVSYETIKPKNNNAVSNEPSPNYLNKAKNTLQQTFNKIANLKPNMPSVANIKQGLANLTQGVINTYNKVNPLGLISKYDNATATPQQSLPIDNYLQRVGKLQKEQDYTHSVFDRVNSFAKLPKFIRGLYTDDGSLQKTLNSSFTKQQLNTQSQHYNLKQARLNLQQQSLLGLDKEKIHTYKLTLNQLQSTYNQQEKNTKNNALNIAKFEKNLKVSGKLLKQKQQEQSLFKKGLKDINLKDAFKIGVLAETIKKAFKTAINGIGGRVSPLHYNERKDDLFALNKEGGEVGNDVRQVMTYRAIAKAMRSPYFAELAYSLSRFNYNQIYGKTLFSVLGINTQRFSKLSGAEKAIAYLTKIREYVDKNKGNLNYLRTIMQIIHDQDPNTNIDLQKSLGLIGGVKKQTYDFLPQFKRARLIVLDQLNKQTNKDFNKSQIKALDKAIEQSLTEGRLNIQSQISDIESLRITAPIVNAVNKVGIVTNQLLQKIYQSIAGGEMGSDTKELTNLFNSYFNSNGLLERSINQNLTPITINNNTNQGRPR